MKATSFAAELATQATDIALRVPQHVFVGEAIDASAFFERHYRTTTTPEGAVQLGLQSAGDKLPATTGTEIVALVGLAQAAQTAYALAATPGLSAEKLARAAYLENEIEAVLEWHFDDGVEDVKDAQLAAVKEAEAQASEATDALAQRLADYAGLAKPFARLLDGLGGFDARLIEEARALASELLLLPPASTRSEASKEKLEARNRILNLLQQKVQLVRDAARFVFRQQPALVRESTSAHARRRRAAARRAALTQPVPAVA